MNAVSITVICATAASPKYTVCQKRVPPYPWLQLCQFLIDLLNSFTAAKSSKFPTKCILGYPPHLKYVAALPWKI